MLTDASRVRELTPEQAEQGYHVRIRGVVTMDAPAPDFFVQDATAGIFVEGSHAYPFEHHLGDFVDLEGVRLSLRARMWSGGPICLNN